MKGGPAMHALGVQSGVGATQNNAFRCAIGVGEKVRLRPEISQLYLVEMRGGKHRQSLIPGNQDQLLGCLRAGVWVDAVQQLGNPVPVVDSATAEDCWYHVHFRTVAGYTYFPAWMFEAVED